MNPEQTKQFNEMITKVNEVYEFVQARKKQQLTLPLDVGSINVLNEAFRIKYFDVIKTRELFLKPGFSVDPNQEGQIVAHDNGGTRVLKAYLQGAVKTITTS